MQVIQVVFGNRLSRTSVSLTQSSSFTNVRGGGRLRYEPKERLGSRPMIRTLEIFCLIVVI